jgi:hypothetical protein
MKDINENDDDNEDIIVKTYGLDSYDEETNQIDELGDLIGGVKGLIYTNPEDDPYITNPEAVDTEDSDDIESLVIRPTDFPLLSAVCEENGISHLDVYLVDPQNLSRQLHSHVHILFVLIKQTHTLTHFSFVFYSYSIHFTSFKHLDRC